MEINYIETPSKKKLFSFNRHDCQTSEGVGIDGGLDYIRLIGNPELKKGEISDLIEDIRQRFIWGRNYDKDNNPLPETEYILLTELTTDHIVFILLYFANRLHPEQKVSKSWIQYHLIFLEELKYRYKNKL